jgi:hypothetical protein
MDLRITVAVDAGGEDFAIEDFKITGTASTGVDNPDSFSAAAASTTQIKLSFTTNNNNDDVVIVYDFDGTFSEPSGAPASAGDAFAGGTVLYNGTTSPQHHAGLSANETVYYKVWSYNGSEYSSGLTSKATTLYLIITEIMQNPDAVNDSYGEWFEIFNAGDGDVDMEGYIIKDNDGNSFTIEGNLTILSKEHLLFANNTTSSENGGMNNVDYEYNSFTLTNGSDQVILTKPDSTEIDRVEYDDGATFPDPTGASMTLNMNELNNNNDGSNWFEATSLYGDEDYGTPGAENDFLTVSWGGSGTSSNWNEASNWSVGSVPTNAYDVTIPTGKKSVEISADQTAECNDLTVDGSLTIKSSSSGTGSLIINGTVTGSISMERYVPGYGTGSNEWHLISSPVQDQNVQGYFVPTTPDADEDLYMWDESQNLWINHKDGVDTWNTSFDDPFQEGKGYLYAIKTNVTKTFTGTPNNTDFSTGTADMPSLSYNSSQGDGWNLLGNPFTSGIDWDELTKTNGINGAVYVRDGTNGQYISWNGSTGSLTDGVIPPGNGFFVKVSVDGQSISIDKGNISGGGDQTHSNNFYKSSKTVDNLVVVNISGNGYEDNTYLRINDSASYGLDKKHDAYKLFGTEDAPQLYSILDDETILSINEFPQNKTEEIVKLGVKVGKESTYTITAPSINDFENVMLEDLKSDKITDLTSEAYEFTAAPDDDEHRFNLHLTKSSTIGVEENSELAGVNVYAHDQNIYFNADENLTNGTMTIYNTIGQVVMTSNVETGSEIIRMENRGAYIVKVQSNEGSLTEKVIIK